MSELERDFGVVEYCIRCHENIHLQDFRDTVSIKNFSHWGFCQRCQDILEEK